jgi:hypothetical protein
MKAWKIISGILSILFSIVVAVISVLHIFATTVSDTPLMGFFGLFAAFLLFLAGLISLCTCRGYLGGNITTLIFYVLTLAASLVRLDYYPHLLFSAVWSGVCALVMFILCFFSRKKKPVEPARTAPIYGGQYYAPQQQYQQPPQGGQYYAPQGQPQYQQAPQYQQPQNGQYYAPQTPQAPPYPQQPTQYPPQSGQGQ